MSCSLQVKNLIFNIEKISSIKKDVYIFIGDIDESLKKILTKIEKKESIKDKNELNKLKLNFKNELPKWLSYIKNKVDIKFIYNLIRVNDNIGLIRKKIFYYCSNSSKNEYILPENQELWVLNENNQFEIIGFYYEDLYKKN